MLSDDSINKLNSMPLFYENDNQRNSLDIFKRTRKTNESKRKSIKSQANNEGEKMEIAKATEQYKNIIEHKIPLDELFNLLNTHPEKGLSSSQAMIFNKNYGDNTLSESKKSPWYIKLFKEMLNPFAIILWTGAFLAVLDFLIGGYDISTIYVAIVLIFIIMGSAFGAFLQNYKSEAIMESFKNIIPLKAKVIRDGVLISIIASKLVPGDIIEIRNGDKIPADVRIISCSEMKVDHSNLNGESDPLPRSVVCTSPDNPLETENLCFFGTLCKEGGCRGVVFNIGDNTLIGRIAALASIIQHNRAPLQKEIDRFVIIIAIIAFGTGVLFLCLGFFLKYSFTTNIIYAIGLITGNVPEGDLIFITVLLTVCSKKLSSRHILAKNLQSVETLGAATCICTDKTGTLTQNNMTVENLWYNGEIKRALNKEKYPKLDLEYNVESSDFQALHECAIVSSEAIFNSFLPQPIQDKLSRIQDPLKSLEELNKATTEWEKVYKEMMWVDKPTIGDASESALIKFFQIIEDIGAMRKRYPLVRINNNTLNARVRFNSVNKFSLSIVEYHKADSEYCIFIKGTPETIWGFCKFIQIGNKRQNINVLWRKEFNYANQTFTKEGQRVLAFAKCHLPSEQFPLGYPFNTHVPAKYPEYKEWNFPLGNMTFLGLISLLDPLRDHVPYSIRKCKIAGIKVIMITGDQPSTALSIARKVNIIDQDARTNLEIIEETGCPMDEAIVRADSIIIHGNQLTEASIEEELLPDEIKGKKLEYWLSKRQVVFAQTSPAQKLAIVEGCQKLGHIVAVTGDGVNDSPAIKKADIGISMGISGSDVAKDVADLILIKDDFSALVVGVEEGRKLYDNLKKCISYSLTTNIPEIIPFMILIIFKLPLPVTTGLLLCLSIGTDMFPAISFAYEDSELDIMVKKPRDRQEHLVSRKLLTFSYLQIGIFESFAGFLTYFIIMSDFGFPFWSLFNLNVQSGWKPNETDVYDPNSPTFGNTNVIGACNNEDHLDLEGNGPYTSFIYTPDWVYGYDLQTDMRMVFIACEKDHNGKVTGGVMNFIRFGNCKERQESSLTHRPICFTVEALKYAQMGYFASVVICQWANVVINKTRKVSLYYHGFRNHYMLWGLVFETCIVFLVSYLPILNIITGTRDTIPLQLGLPALPFSLMILIYDEIRKRLIVYSSRNKQGEIEGWWARNCAW